METNVIESEAIEYDVLKTIYLIKINEDLTCVFETLTSKTIDEIISDIRNNSLDEVIDNTLREIFDSIIKVENEYLDIYKVITTLPEDEIKIIAPKPKEIKVKSESKFELPRRYGKDKILKDIKNDNRGATQIEKAMFSLNTIKNIYCVLERKLINDLFSERGLSDEKQILTDIEYRDIIAIQELMTNKLKTILNKK